MLSSPEVGRHPRRRVEAPSRDIELQIASSSDTELPALFLGDHFQQWRKGFFSFGWWWWRSFLNILASKSI